MYCGVTSAGAATIPETARTQRQVSDRRGNAVPANSAAQATPTHTVTTTTLAGHRISPRMTEPARTGHVFRTSRCCRSPRKSRRISCGPNSTPNALTASEKLVTMPAAPRRRLAARTANERPITAAAIGTPMRSTVASLALSICMPFFHTKMPSARPVSGSVQPAARARGADRRALASLVSCADDLACGELERVRCPTASTASRPPAPRATRPARSGRRRHRAPPAAAAWRQTARARWTARRPRSCAPGEPTSPTGWLPAARETARTIVPPTMTTAATRDRDRHPRRAPHCGRRPTSNGYASARRRRSRHASRQQKAQIATTNCTRAAAEAGATSATTITEAMSDPICDRRILWSSSCRRVSGAENRNAASARENSSSALLAGRSQTHAASANTPRPASDDPVACHADASSRPRTAGRPSVRRPRRG